MVASTARAVPADHPALSLLKQVGAGDKARYEIHVTTSADRRRRIHVRIAATQTGGNAKEAQRLLCLAFAGRLQGWPGSQATAYITHHLARARGSTDPSGTMQPTPQTTVSRATSGNDTLSSAVLPHPSSGPSSATVSRSHITPRSLFGSDATTAEVTWCSLRHRVLLILLGNLILKVLYLLNHYDKLAWPSWHPSHHHASGWVVWWTWKRRRSSRRSGVVPVFEGVRVRVSDLLNTLTPTPGGLPRGVCVDCNRTTIQSTLTQKKEHER